MAKLDDLKLKPKTYVAIILDKSQSMGSIAKFAVDTYNEQLASIRETAEEQEVSISLIQFDSDVEFKAYNTILSETTNLEMKDYIPGTMTAMNDAIGLTIARLQKEEDINDKNVSVLIVVITDGMENASKEYTKPIIAKQIKELQETDRWTFTYLGANVDVNQIARDYNFDAGNVQSYAATGAGMAKGSLLNSVGTSRFMKSRLAGATRSASFYSGPDEDEDNE